MGRAAPPVEIRRCADDRAPDLAEPSRDQAGVPQSGNPQGQIEPPPPTRWRPCSCTPGCVSSTVAVSSRRKDHRGRGLVRQARHGLPAAPGWMGARSPLRDGRRSVGLRQRRAGGRPAGRDDDPSVIGMPPSSPSLLNFGFRPQSRRPPRRIKHGGCHLPMRRYLRRQLVT
jgi:hypothetical protein